MNDRGWMLRCRDAGQGIWHGELKESAAPADGARYEAEGRWLVLSDGAGPDALPLAAQLADPDQPALVRQARACVAEFGLQVGAFRLSLQLGKPALPPLLAPAVRVVPLRSPTLAPHTCTNLYLVGEAQLALVDPGCECAEELSWLEAVLERLEARVDEIWLTHLHHDHVCGADTLRRRFAAPVRASARTAEDLHGRLKVDRLFDEGEILERAGQRFEVMTTPGHAQGHIVFRALEGGCMLVGDMLAGVGTVVIDPPQGDLKAYLSSLRRLCARQPSLLLAAHGPPIRDAVPRLEQLIAHRLRREAMVLAALRAASAPVLPRDLVPEVYAGYPKSVYAAAARSLLAHLLKLVDDGLARREQRRFMALGA